MKQILLIGRAKDNDIIVSDPSVSKQHAQLVIDAADDIGIVDLNSTNGTMVNGKRIQGYTKLHPGDRVHLGNHLLTWQTYAREFGQPKPVQQAAPPPPSPATTGASKRPTEQLPRQAPERVVVHVPSPQRNSGINSLIWGLGVLALVGIAVFVVLKSTGTSLEAALAKPRTYGLSAQCGPVANILLASTAEVRVENRSDKTHRSVSVRVKGYDRGGTEQVSKLVTMLEAIPPSRSYTQPITLPAKVRSCTCEVVDSNPY
jgi:pSer/pThr/pTyr-binding forkhead associated (FHA) protein